MSAVVLIMCLGKLYRSGAAVDKADHESSDLAG